MRRALRDGALAAALALAGCGPRVWVVRSWESGGVIGVRGSGPDADRALRETARGVCGIQRAARFVGQQTQSQQVDCSYQMPQTDTSTTNVQVGATTGTATTTTTTYQTVQQTCTDSWQEYEVSCVESAPPQASYQPPASPSLPPSATPSDGPRVRALGGQRYAFITTDGFASVTAVADRFCTSEGRTAHVDEASTRRDGSIHVRFECR